MSEDLFNVDRALTPQERKRLFGKPRKAGHAAIPGTGPTGETCGSCKHLFRRHMAKTYLKCALMRPRWSNGAGTDIRAGDPACKHWEPNTTTATASPTKGDGS